MLWMVALDVVLPLALYYGLRGLDVNQWLALEVSGVLPLARLVYKIIRERRVEKPTLFTLSVVVVGTVVSLLTGNPRLLLARESYLTGLLGLWMASTLLAERPLIYTATLPLLPPETAETWRQNWATRPEFRRVLRLMTIAWSLVFLIDAVARVVMAYTMPVDTVPVVSISLLVAMLVGVVQLSKVYGRRVMARADRQRD